MASKKTPQSDEAEYWQNRYEAAQEELEGTQSLLEVEREKNRLLERRISLLEAKRK